jgi:uncharacterized protein (DUF305 family)
MKGLITVVLLTFALFTAPGVASPVSKGISGMMEMSVGSELEFLAGMVPHHQDASEDASIALERSKRPEIQQLAQEIIDAQEAEITRMEAWLAEWYPGSDREKAVSDMNQMMSMDMPNLENLSGDAFDRAFFEGMIMHHQMAIQMVDSLLSQKLAEHDEVRVLAHEIRSAQNAEIAEMQGYLEAWFGKTVEVGHAHG